MPSGQYILATIHRAENTDEPRRLRGIFEALDELSETCMTIICPVHPRTRRRLMEAGWRPESHQLQLVEPVAYTEMLALQRNARLVVTDSGGVQKEAFILGVPCLTLREETEWVETLQAGWNTLVGAESASILSAVRASLARGIPPTTGMSFGDGHTAERIVETLSRTAA
jgi:UDP-N-acetylglucosamine 2-epimerase